MAGRRRFSAVLREFTEELRRLSALDRDNQCRLATSPGPVTAGVITRKQLYLLTEGILFYSYRCYENFVRDSFILHCLEKPDLMGRRTRSYIRPRNFTHAEDLIQSTMRYVDWSNPDDVIKRSELYLRDGGPVKTIFVANRVLLHELRKLRKHIAHNSAQSRRGYIEVLQRRLATAPVRTPTVGEYLLMGDPADPPRYYLLIYLEKFEELATSLAGR